MQDGGSPGQQELHLKNVVVVVVVIIIVIVHFPTRSPNSSMARCSISHFKLNRRVFSIDATRFI
jgi:hypothetical protein